MGFVWLDWLLFSLLLAVSMVIGIYAWWSSRRARTTHEMLMGGRQLSVLPVSLSIFMSFTSAIMTLGITAEMYHYGTQMWLTWIGYVLGYIAAAWFVVPLFHRMNLTSSFQYLEARFQTKVTRLAGNILLIVYQCFYMGMATFAPATALNAATGFPIWAAIIVEIIVATFYTSLGGMKAVVWTDAIQAIVFATGIIAAVVMGTIKVGGIANVWEVAKEHGRFDMWNFNMNPYEDRLTFWACIVGIFFTSLFSMGFQQTSVQRYCSIASLAKARISILIIIPIEILITTLTCMVGLVVFAYHTQQGCDPLRVEGELDGPNQLLPDFITNVIAVPGLSGLFMAVLFSGALSSLSSSLNALSAVVWKDILEKKFSNLAEHRKAIATQCLVILFGVVATIVALAVQYMGVHVMQASASLNSTASGPLLGMFLVGILFPWANGIATAIAAIMSLAVMMWISLGANITTPHRSYLETVVSNCNLTGNITVAPIPEDVDTLAIYKMSFYWYDSTGAIMTVMLSLIITFFTGFMNTSKLDPGLVVNIFDLLCPCMPARWRHKLRCGVPTSDDYSTAKKNPDATDRNIGKSSEDLNMFCMDNKLPDADYQAEYNMALSSDKDFF